MMDVKQAIPMQLVDQILLPTDKKRSLEILDREDQALLTAATPSSRRQSTKSSSWLRSDAGVSILKNTPAEKRRKVQRDKDADETSDAARDRRLQHVEDSFADAAALDIAVKDGSLVHPRRRRGGKALKAVSSLPLVPAVEHFRSSWGVGIFKEDPFTAPKQSPRDCVVYFDPSDVRMSTVMQPTEENAPLCGQQLMCVREFERVEEECQLDRFGFLEQDDRVLYISFSHRFAFEKKGVKDEETLVPCEWCDISPEVEAEIRERESKVQCSNWADKF